VQVGLRQTVQTYADIWEARGLRNCVFLVATFRDHLIIHTTLKTPAFHRNFTLLNRCRPLLH